MRAMRTTILLGALAITGLTASIQAPDADAAKVNCKAAQVTNKGLCKALNKCEKKRGNAKRRCRSAAKTRYADTRTPTPTPKQPTPTPTPAPTPAPAPTPTPAPTGADLSAELAETPAKFGEDRMPFNFKVIARNLGPMNVHAQNAVVVIRAKGRTARRRWLGSRWLHERG